MSDAIACKWTNGVFIPAPRFADKAGELFVEGATYWLNIEPERSEKTHKHEFAWLREAWKTLPESIAHLYPSTEHLRKRALIEAGFYTETIVDAGTTAAALRVAAFARGEDEFALVITRGPIVVVRKAKSQSHRAMGAANFQRSKQAALEVVSAMLGIEPQDLARAA